MLGEQKKQKALPKTSRSPVLGEKEKARRIAEYPSLLLTLEDPLHRLVALPPRLLRRHLPLRVRRSLREQI